MEKEMPSWLAEILDEAEEKEQKQLFEMNKLRADQALAAISIIESQIAEVEDVAEEEMKLIQQWKESRLEKLGKKINWLAFNLEQFIRKTDESTIQLAHGTIKVRKSKDKVEIVDIKKFLPIGEKLGLLRTTPAKTEPDLVAIGAYIKLNGGKPPSGVMLTPGQPKFSYKTTKGKDDADNNEREQTETGSDDRAKSPSQIAA